MTRTPVLTRREALLLSAKLGVVAAVPAKLLASDSIKTGVHQEEPGTVSTPRSAIARTQYGPVRGFLAGGVFTFKGVPYGQNTGGENRWLPLKPPTPWTEEYLPSPMAPTARSPFIHGPLSSKPLSRTGMTVG